MSTDNNSLGNFNNTRSSKSYKLNNRSNNKLDTDSHALNLKYFLITVLTTYYASKFTFLTFYNLPTKVKPDHELIDLATTITLSAFIYLISGYYQLDIHWLFYLGIFIGTNYPALHHFIFGPTTHTTLSSQNTQKLLTSVLYFKVTFLLLLLLYVAVTSNQRDVYLFYMGVFLVMLIRHLYAERPTDSNKGRVDQFGVSFVTFSLLMFFIFPHQTSPLQLLVQLLFGMVLGAFIANMAYQGPDYLYKDYDDEKRKDVEKQLYSIPPDKSEMNVIRWLLVLLIFFNLVIFVLYFVKNLF